MLDRKEEKGKCPFNKFKVCREDCVFYRRGVRVNDVTNETVPVELCAVNVIADNIEQMHNKVHMSQKEMGEMKNMTAFKILSDYNLVHEQEVIRKAKRVIEESGEVIELNHSEVKKIT
jgi:hypothetical protein